MDLVIRFNKLQSYRCGERMDVWASRHGDAVTTRYWGIGCLSPHALDSLRITHVYTTETESLRIAAVGLMKAAWFSFTEQLVR